MNQRELVWVEVPYSDFSGKKIRPAVIVSNNAYNRKSEDMVICAITSNTQKTDYSVTISENDLEKGKLKVASKIRADKIMQIDKKLALKAFARLNSRKFSETTAQIKKLVSEN